MRGGPVTWLLLGCAGGPDSADTGVEPVEPWVETLAPDAFHVLVGSTPGEGTGAAALEELAVDNSLRFSLSFDDDAGTAGAIRNADGSTTYAKTWPPQALGSAIEAVNAAGELLWSDDSYFSSFSFVHGLELGPQGEFIVADTTAGTVFAVTPEGEPLWSLNWQAGGVIHWPNGVHVATTTSGETLMAVSLLVQAGAGDDRVEVYTIGTAGPEPRWTYEAGDASWPHGPHVEEDGSVLASLAARGQVIRLVDGALDWTIPPEPGVLAFPRDAVFLPDGSLLVADAASDLLRIGNPMSTFEVVGARATSGIYGLDVLDCAEEACLGG